MGAPQASAAPARTGVVAINYWRALAVTSTFATGAHTGSLVQHFTNMSGTPTLNDLTDGILPDDRFGELLSVQCVNVTDLPVTTLNVQKCVQDWIQLQLCLVEVFVSNLAVWRMPIYACCAPPTWIQGTPVAPAANENTASVQNGGYMLQTVAHPIERRQTLRVQLGLTTFTNLGVAQRILVVAQTRDTKGM